MVVYSRLLSQANIQIVRQFLLFTVVGAIGTIVQYLILVILSSLFSVWPVISSGVGFVTGALVNYFLNYYITFGSSKAHLIACARFFSIALVGLCLNTIIMYVIIKYASIHYLVAQLLATGIVLIWNFTANKCWTFRGE